MDLKNNIHGKHKTKLIIASESKYLNISFLYISIESLSSRKKEGKKNPKIMPKVFDAQQIDVTITL